MTAGARSGRLAYRAFGRFHRDARLILVTSLVAGAALSLYWIDFNLYLVSLGLSHRDDRPRVDDRVDRRRAGRLPGQRRCPTGSAGGLIFAGGLAGVPRWPCSGSWPAMRSLALIVFAAALWSAGQPGDAGGDLAVHDRAQRASHRNELFAIQFAIQNVTNIVAAILGGVVAGVIAGVDRAGSRGGPGPTA